MLDVVIEEDGKPARSVRVERFPCRIGKARDSEVALAELARGPRARRDPSGRAAASSWWTSARWLAPWSTATGSSNTVRCRSATRSSSRASGCGCTERRCGRRRRPSLRSAGCLPTGPAQAPALLPACGRRPAVTAAPLLRTRRSRPADLQIRAPCGARGQLAALPWRRLVHRRLLESDRPATQQPVAVLARAAARGGAAGRGRHRRANSDALPADIDRPALVRDTVDEAIGLGPLERLMAQADISEIMVNSAVDIFVERSGRLERATRRILGRYGHPQRDRAHRGAPGPAHRRSVAAGGCAPGRRLARQRHHSAGGAQGPGADHPPLQPDRPVAARTWCARQRLARR